MFRAPNATVLWLFFLLQDCFPCDGEARAKPPVFVIVKGHHGVEAVVAAGQLHKHEDAAVGIGLGTAGGPGEG